MFTTKALRTALFASTFCATWSVADANPRRVTVLDFDGPRTLADSGRSAVMGIVGDAYDVVSSKKWLDAKADASRKKHGPDAWNKASKTAGVDAVVEGWVQEDGHSKTLTLVVTDASNGNVFDQLTLKIGDKVTGDAQKKIKAGLEERFVWIQPLDGGADPTYEDYKEKPSKSVKDKRRIVGAKDQDDSEPAPADDEDRPRKKRSRDRSDDDASDDRPARPRKSRKADRADRDDRDEVTEKEPKKVATIETTEAKTVTKKDKEDNYLQHVFRPVSEEEDIVTGGKASHVPQPTAKFRISGGFHYMSRSLYIQAEQADNVTQYASVPHKGLGIQAEFYPFPTKKIDGVLSGIGFSFNIEHSLGSNVTFDDGDTVGDYSINASAWNAGIHYRTPLGKTFAIDGEVSYGSQKYSIVDAPQTFEVPDTDYSYLAAGGTLDMKITEKSSIGFSAKYMYMLGTGDLNSTDWYGPGTSSGIRLGANFIVPLPKNIYIRGDLEYTRIHTIFDGVGEITDPEGVSESVDSTIGGRLQVGIQF